jgi:hypothetical protein
VVARNLLHSLRLVLGLVLVEILQLVNSVLTVVHRNLQKKAGHVHVVQ